MKEEAITINHHVNIGVVVAVEDGSVVLDKKFTDAIEFILKLWKLSEILLEEQKNKKKKKIITNRNGAEVLLSF
jgi:pyruvate dehydrogenase E2 component (dihydrolipoamide acetyltransferase)